VGKEEKNCQIFREEKGFREEDCKLWIQTCIPYERGDNLCYACNRVMETSSAPWVLILDHDVYLDCNPLWYEICLEAIKRVGDNAGWITCLTNRISNTWQHLYGTDEESEDMSYHIHIAQQCWKRYGMTMLEIKHKLSGFFILTNKKAWEASGGFKPMWAKGAGVISGMSADTSFSNGLDRTDYKKYVLLGLYVFHFYKVKNKYQRKAFNSNLLKSPHKVIFRGARKENERLPSS